MGVAFGTEAGLFSEARIPFIVCGLGSIEQAHKPNEYVSCRQIGEYSEFIQRLVKWAST